MIISCITPFLFSPTTTALVAFGLDDLQGSFQTKKIYDSTLVPYHLTPPVVIRSRGALFSTHTLTRLFFLTLCPVTPSSEVFYVSHCHCSDFLNWHSKALCNQAWDALLVSIQVGLFTDLSHAGLCLPIPKAECLSLQPTSWISLGPSHLSWNFTTSVNSSLSIHFNTSQHVSFDTVSCCGWPSLNQLAYFLN